MGVTAVSVITAGDICVGVVTVGVVVVADVFVGVVTAPRGGVVAIGVFASITAYVLRVVVDEGGSLQVGVEQVVQGVLLGQLAVHGDQDSFQDDVGVAEVGNNLVDAVVRGVGDREAARKHACGGEGLAGVRPTSPPAPPRHNPLCRLQTPERVWQLKTPLRACALTIFI